MEVTRFKVCERMTQFEELVDLYNRPLYRFALSLVRDLDRAVELVVRTFVIWHRKEECDGYDNAETELFATLYREHTGRFGSQWTSGGQPMLTAPAGENVSRKLVEPLGSLDRDLVPTLTLFYLQRHDYREIARILDLPIGTVMARISSGKEQLQSRDTGKKDG